MKGISTLLRGVVHLVWSVFKFKLALIFNYSTCSLVFGLLGHTALTPFYTY